ncbi:MAG: sulfurtransferase TusA family protein, partial [Pseudomonadales bacterium]
MNTYKLDARRLLCPMPVIRTQDRVRDLEQGDLLTVYCTDPGTLEDIPSWCRVNGHQVIETKQENSEIHITIRV